MAKSKIHPITNIKKLKQIVESVGCEMKQYSTGFS